jgi:ABC-2 type transport system permease protein
MGSVIAVYRENRIFKRLLTTPLRVSTFFASQITARLLLSVIQALIIFAAGIFLFHAQVYGSLLWALVLVIPANIIFLNLGFVVGAFAKNVEAAASLGNLETVPMMFFSGVFFPTDSLPRALAWVVGFLPLSPLLDAMRGMLLHSRPLWSFPGELAILGAWVAVSSFLAVRFFRFE